MQKYRTVQYSRINRTTGRIRSARQDQIEARRRQERLETIKNYILAALLIGCFIAAAYLDGQSLREGIL